MASAGSVAEAPARSALGSAQAAPGKRVLLVSNRVMHYRVSVYNYFWKNFRDRGWDFAVLINELQKQNQNQCQFQLIERAFNLFEYRSEMQRLKPAVVILCLHMKDKILW